MLSLSLSMIFFALPLSGLWNSGQSEQYLLGGLLPSSDGLTYYMDARSLLEGRALLSAPRPLFSAFFLTFYWLANQNLQIVLIILVLVNVFSVYIAAREVNRTHGSVAAVAMFILLFQYYRLLIGKPMSEHLGLSLSVLGFALLWKSVLNRNRFYALLGIFLTTFALSARAGAFFVLPMLVLWFAWFFRNRGWISLKNLVFGVVSVASVTLIITLLYQSVFSGLPYSNFAHSLYGLATGGKGWQQIFTYHPEVFRLPAEQQSARIYELSFEEIRTQPIKLVFGTLTAWQMFFTPDGYYGAFCFFGGEEETSASVLRIILFGFLALGIFLWLRHRRDPFLALLMCSLIGIMLSLPFAPPLDTNRMRAYAATMPYFLAFPALSIGWFSSRTPWKLFKPTAPEAGGGFWGSIMGIFLVLVTVLGPFLVLTFRQPSKFALTPCPEGNVRSIMRITPGSYLNVQADSALERDRIPDLRQKTFVRLAHNFPTHELFDVINNIQPNTTIIQEMDLLTGIPTMAFIPMELFPKQDGDVIQICGNWYENATSRSNKVLYASQVKVITSP